MSTPSEPLLPVEPETPSRLKLWLLPAGAGVAAAAVLVAILAGRGTNPDPAESSAPASAERNGARPLKMSAAAPVGSAPDRSEERQAKALYDAAESFEGAEPGDYERRAARWREVVTTFPTTAWARKADERHRAATASLQAFLDREFESTRKDAQALAAAGHFVDAIDTINSFKASQTRDLLKRRADLEIGLLENSSRLAFNETAAKAKELAAKQSFAPAIALFEALAESAIPEVAARCRVAIEQLRAASEAHELWAGTRRGNDARKAFRESSAPKLLELVRARQYDDALRELSSAASANADLKEVIASERASIADASSFWEAFLKALRARSGQDATILLADGKRWTGRISRIQADRIVLDLGDSTVDAPLDKIHADLLVGWTLGRTLAAEDPVSYLKAALFFFCEGRDDLAKLYLATARELNGQVDEAEKVFRGGLLRSAMPLRK
jgi:hypothetical protein